MAKGRTLWEMLTGKKETPVEDRFFNPMQAKIGSAVAINDIDLKQYDFVVQEIHEYRRTIQGKPHLFTDYLLHAQPLKGEAVVVRLRVNPVGKTDGGPAHTVVVLRLYDQFGYDKGFHDVVSDTTKKIEVTENNLTTAYTRINEMLDSFKPTVSVVRDANQDGKVEEEEVESLDVEYWDYWRQMKDEGGNATVQFLFVEMNKTSGWFQLWRGEVINPERVTIL